MLDFEDRCPGCGQEAEWWFDRTLCPEPCGVMHYYTVCCGMPDDCQFVEE